MNYFKTKNQVHLVCGMKIKPLDGIKITTPEIPFQIPVYQGRNDVKINIKLSEISDKEFFKLIDIFTKAGLESVKGNTLMHANHCSILPYCCSKIKEKTGVKYVVSAHGTGVNSSLESKRNYKIAKEGLENSEYILANSKFTANQIKKEFNINSSKIIVVYLGVDTDEFKPVPGEKKNKVKQKYNCLGKKLVLSTGFLTKEKGHEDLINAAKQYEKEGVTTLISGDGPYFNYLKNLIKKLNLRHTYLLGWVTKEELLELYGAADIYVFPSRWSEPFGMVAIEAMACETPVIGARSGAIPEIISEHGLLFNPGKHQEIAKAVVSTVKNDKWLKEHATKSREHIISNFSVELMCENTKKIYDMINK